MVHMIEQIIYRAMERGDVERILAAEYEKFISSSTQKRYEKFFDEQERGLRTVIIAELNGELVGRVTLLHSASGVPFKNMNIPEVLGLSVLEKYRKQGIGTELMKCIEEAAEKMSDTVCLGVGICESDGAAQRLFAKRGYIPDGSGAWYGRQAAHRAGRIETIESLVLYMLKELR